MSDEETGHVKLAKGTGGTYTGLRPGCYDTYAAPLLQHCTRGRTALRSERHDIGLHNVI